MATRVKQLRQAAGLGIKSCQVWSLEPIAWKARQRQIAGHRLATMRGCQHMVDFKREVVEPLWHMAVFTDRVGPTPDEFFQVAVHG